MTELPLLRIGALALLALALGQACGSDPLPGPKPAPSANAGAGGQCEPTSCAEQGVECGDVDDGCGDVLRCGDECAQGGAGGTGSCTPVDPKDSPAATARQARSRGFSGQPEAYAALFDLPCDEASECVDACAEAGGSETMCAASECLALAEAQPTCLPAPVWSGLENLQAEGEAREDMTQIIVVPGDYRDYLLADELGLVVPLGATILGVTVELSRAGSDAVVDDSVRLIQGGRIGEAERAQPGVWSDELTTVSYGGPDDLWGEDWTPEAVNAPDFGVAFSAAYTRAAGNTRAYVDGVRVTVRYEVTCP